MKAMIVCMLIAISGPASAERLVIKPGSRVTIEEPGKPIVVVLVGAPHFLIDREMADSLTAEADLSEELQRSLLTCKEDVIRAGKKNAPAPGWYTAVKWAGVGGAVIGAFVLGAVTGR